MSCPWFLLKEISLVASASENRALYELYPDNPSAPLLGIGNTDKTKFYIYPNDLTHSSNPHSYATALKVPATLPFFRTVAIEDAPSTRTTALDKIKVLYQELGQLGVEYVACFEEIRPIFIVCSSTKAARLVLQSLPTITWSSKHVFTREIYVPTSCTLERYEKIKAWSHVFLWGSIEERDLRLRVRNIDHPFKGFEDLCWKFQENCHHRSRENDQDKEGEVTLWVESSGSRKDFETPLGKGKRSVNGHLSPGKRKVDHAIGIIQSGIQNLLSPSATVVGLRLVFVKIQDCKDFKDWLVPSVPTRNSEEDTNKGEGSEFQYPPAFPVSAMRHLKIPIPSPPSQDSLSTVPCQVEPGSSYDRSSTTELDRIIPVTGNQSILSQFSPLIGYDMEKCEK